MNIKYFITLFIVMQVTLCYSQSRGQSRDVKRISGKAYLLSNGNQYEIVEEVVFAKLKAGKKKVRDNIKVIKSHPWGMLEIAVPDSVTTEEYLETLEKTGEFESVEFDTYIIPCMSVNDTYYYEQWGLRHIHADEAWEISTGSPSVKIAVIEKDSFELYHPDLYYGNDTYSNINVSEYVDYVFPPDTALSDSHSTMVAGIISAKTNNGIGVAGIAGGNGSEGSKIIPYHTKTAYQTIDAIYDAIEKGAKVINMSYSCNESTDYNQALINAYNNGVTIVCGSGNDSIAQITYPASNEYTIAVGAIDSNNNRAVFSNYGDGLDLVAPGVGIKNTGRSKDYYYAVGSGTSFAAPHVSGVVALMLSVNPNLTPNEIKNILIHTTKRIRPIDYPYNSSGWNENVGYGLLDACASVMTVKNYTISGPSTICYASTNTYTIDNPISGSTIWHIDNNNFSISPSNNQCFVTYTGAQQYNIANLTATITWMGTPIKTITKRIVMHGTDLYATGWQYGEAYTPNGIYPEIEFTIPDNSELLLSKTKPQKPNKEDFDSKESLPIEFTKDFTPLYPDSPPFDFCGYGITEIYGGNMVYIYSDRFDGMNISFSGFVSPTFLQTSNNYVAFNIPYQNLIYYTTLQAQSEDHCHDFCLMFKVKPLPGAPSGDDEIWINYTGSMLYITFMGSIGEPIGNGQFYLPPYNVTISKIPAGTQVYSNTFSGDQYSFSVNTSSWTSGIYSIRIVQNGHIYTKSIYL